MKRKSQRKIIVSVTNDLATDNRVHKVCSSLVKFGYSVTLVGRKLPNSLPLKEERNYQTKRMWLIFKKGPLFYAEYNKRLLLFLLLRKADILLSNDLDTLPANYLASIIKRKPLVFDSHEYFTEVPELIGRPRVQKAWKWIEKKIVPKLKYAYTVCESIANLFEQEYQTRFEVVRNIPIAKEPIPVPKEKRIADDKKIILYQGALNIGRGLPEVIRSMQYVDNSLLLLAGDGDITSQLKELVNTLNLQQKVRFLGRLPLEELSYITQQAHLGLSIEKDMGLNYRFALPNKLFDYIHAHVPVMVTNLPEMVKIVKGHNIGIVIDSHDPEAIAKAITHAVSDEKERKTWIVNLKKASKEFTWENEEKVLEKLFNKIAST